MRDDTGVIFASAFPGMDAFADEMERHYTDLARRQQLEALRSLRARVTDAEPVAAELDHRIREIEALLAEDGYQFDRRFLFRVLSMGHSQFAEIIGARGPNTQVNSACASTTQAISLAEDWIRAGRCTRVVIVAGDDVTSDNLVEWIGAGFLASGAAATDAVVENAALPFDNRRHGMIMGMGAAGLVVESAPAARERGIQPICEVLATVTANSAFHGTRLDVEHIGSLMERLVVQAEGRGVRRHDIAPEMVFVSHETYTPARGGSAAAEINALRRVFGPDADRIVIANTKGFTGHPMGVGIEDVVAVKSLETGLIPPIPNFREIDPELGSLNLSTGGAYPVRFALRLAAGFGSQISMTLLRWTPMPDGAHREPTALGYGYRIVDSAAWTAWLRRMSGAQDPQLEVVQRRLRVIDGGRPAPVAAPAPVAQAAPVAPVVPVPPPMPPAPAPVVPAAPTVDPVVAEVLAVVSAKTGYPVEMLDLDLDLEADLGVDTVKQAEVFAAIRESFAIPRDDALALRDYPTLTHVVGFVRDRGTNLPAAPTAAAPVAASPVAVAPVSTAGPAEPSVDPVVAEVLAVVSAKTGYPVEMLDLDLDLEADLGVDTVKQAEVFAAIRESFAIPRDDALALRDYPTLTHVVGFVRDRGTNLPAAPTAAAPVAASPVAVAPVSTAGPAEPSVDPVVAEVLAVVSAKTGYPVEMLDLDLDLEADLGVDTVKQAEVFAAIRESFAIPRDDALALRDYPTLTHVVGFVRDRGTNLPAAPTAAAPVAASPVAVAPVSTAGPAEPSVDPVVAEVLAVVSAKTGYPVEMLDLDLDLEADLGVDTVKQAEIFAAIRESFGIARDDALALRDYPTLTHVVGFVRERATNLPAASSAEAATEASATPDIPVLTGSLEAADLIARRVPVPVLRPALDRCRPTGVTLDETARVVVMADRGGVGDALAGQLRKAGVEVLVIDDAPDAAVLVERLSEFTAKAPATGIYWLPALDAEGPIGELDLAAWHEALRVRVKLLFVTMHALVDSAPFLVTATRLGGLHGYDPAGAVNPMGGAVTGFAKAYSREAAGTLVKAVDLAASRKTVALADLLIAETLRDPGCVEVGYAGDARWTIGLQEQPAADGQPGLVLDDSTVYIVTGAAGSIVSAIVADLARAGGGGVFHLLDLAPAPDPADADLAHYAADREGLKAELIARHAAAGEKVTPVVVERELAALERGSAALAAIEAVAAAGGRAVYHSVDLTDVDDVAEVVAQAVEDSGRVDVLVHAAGIEISRRIGVKEPAEFDRVLGVKSDGWFALMSALNDTPLGAAVAFSSVAGRFGNLGQTDYSAANDLLCKLVSNLRTSRPDTRGIAIDWTAWGGIGMATRGSIPTMMAAAGIDMLPPEAGIATVRRELTAGGTRDEIVVAGRLGMMTAELADDGGLDVGAMDVDGAGPMIGTVLGMGVHSGLVVETTLDPSEQPFLDDHRIDGTAVLPGVMGIEGFAELAGLAFPDRHVVAIEDVDFLMPLKFYRDQPRTLRLIATFSSDVDDVIADCRLEASRTLVGHDEPETTVHFTGRVRLAPGAAEPMEAPAAGDPSGPVVGRDAVYAVYFHGPAFQVLDAAWRSDGATVGRWADDLPPGHLPHDGETVAVPRLVELCFQTAGVAGLADSGVMALPAHVDRLVLPAQPENGDGHLVARAVPGTDGAVDAVVVDGAGHVYARLEGYRTTAVPGGLDDSLLAPLRTLSVAE
jgi:3-oxoacyl-(acyl-carrier-protein) synthase/NAD(P)-dependent dehydrogenase (short-subunit alcohol dehydrogenase family)/acyl carrier protein